MQNSLSAGLLMYRIKNRQLEVLLAHPGGPYYCDKDDRYWGIPKGHVEAGETILAGAFREFREETGFAPPVANLIYLGSTKGHHGRIIHAWAFEGDCDTTLPVQSNMFKLEWPPNSGQEGLFPEIDKISFFSIPELKKKIELNQLVFILRLESMLVRNKSCQFWKQRFCLEKEKTKISL